jgi:streptogramin lyase
MSVLVRSAALAAVFLALAATASLAAITPTVTEFGEGSITNNAAATGIALGPDGNMYISEFGSAGNRLAQVTPNGVVTELPQFSSPNIGVQNLVTGPGGKLYLTEWNVGKIGVFDLAAPTALDEHAVPSGGSSKPHEITVGPDGNIWFTEAQSNLIGMLSPSDPATIHEFPTGGLGASAQPYGITTGPDGAVWFAERAGNSVDRLDPADPNSVQRFNTGLTASSQPRMLAVGPDGRVWFTEQGVSQIGAIDPVSHVIQEFPLPTASANPIGIARGPDGAMWFTENLGGDTQKGAVGRITPDGTITEYKLTPADSQSFTGVWNIIQGPDGNMWWTEIEDERVGRITTPPVATTGALTAVAETAATVAGTVDGHAQATSLHVDYGPTAAYGSSTPEQSLGAITGPHAVAATLSGLAPSTTYHYRVVATNPTGSAFGSDAAFTTASPLAAPAVSGLRIGKRWRLGSKLPKFSRKVPTGTTIRFVLSEAARVKLRFARQLPGRRAGRRCVAPRRAKGKRCTRSVDAGTLSLNAHSGNNFLRFQGRLSRRRTLKAGRYKLTLTATANGKTSKPRTATFTVLPKKS